MKHLASLVVNALFSRKELDKFTGENPSTIVTYNNVTVSSESSVGAWKGCQGEITACFLACLALVFSTLGSQFGGVDTENGAWQPLGLIQYSNVYFLTSFPACQFQECLHDIPLEQSLS